MFGRKSRKIEELSNDLIHYKSLYEALYGVRDVENDKLTSRLKMIYEALHVEDSCDVVRLIRDLQTDNECLKTKYEELLRARNKKKKVTKRKKI